MIIGISGPSCSGKTTLAREIATLLGAPTLHLDRHFIDMERPIVNGHQSYERPDQYDGEALRLQMEDAARTGSTVVAEGFLLFHYPGVADLCDVMIHLDVPHEVLAERRAARAAAKASASDVKGGRHKAADDGWSAHGEAEWLAYGAFQADLPGIVLIRPGITHAAAQADIAAGLVASWERR